MDPQAAPASFTRQFYRAGRTLVRRHRDFRRRGDLVDGLTYALTYRCNSRCLTCDIWKDAGDVSRELTPAELVSSFAGSRRLSGLRWVNLTGGEPFLRDEIVEIGRWFLETYPDLELRIPTNGILVPKTLKLLHRMAEGGHEPRICLGVSLDGLEAEHDHLRGIPGNFAKCMELLEAVRRDFPRMRVGIGVTVTPVNLDSLLPLFDLSRARDVGFSARLAQESFYYQNGPGAAPGTKAAPAEELRESVRPAAWTPELRQRAHALLLKVRDRRFGPLDDFWKMVDASYLFLSQAVDRTFAARRSYDCVSGTYSFFLDPFGNVRPCIMLDRALGNLRDRSFDEIWEGEAARDVRRAIEERQCNCWTECETIGSIERSRAFALQAVGAALEDRLRSTREPAP